MSWKRRRWAKMGWVTLGPRCVKNCSEKGEACRESRSNKFKGERREEGRKLGLKIFHHSSSITTHLLLLLFERGIFLIPSLSIHQLTSAWEKVQRDDIFLCLIVMNRENEFVREPMRATHIKRMSVIQCHPFIRKETTKYSMSIPSSKTKRTINELFFAYLVFSFSNPSHFGFFTHKSWHCSFMMNFSPSSVAKVLKLLRNRS